MVGQQQGSLLTENQKTRGDMSEVVRELIP